jgi:hypothetical protein
MSVNIAITFKYALSFTSGSWARFLKRSTSNSECSLTYTHTYVRHSVIEIFLHLMQTSYVPRLLCSFVLCLNSIELRTGLWSQPYDVRWWCLRYLMVFPTYIVLSNSNLLNVQIVTSKCTHICMYPHIIKQLLSSICYGHLTPSGGCQKRLKNLTFLEMFRRVDILQLVIRY